MKPLSIIRAVKGKKEDDLLSIPGVTGVDIGRKITKGKKTDELSIRVFVEKKKKQVPDAEKIPDEIDGIKTDVIERKFVLHGPATAKVEDVRPQADTATYDPLVGGISIGPCGAVGGFVFTGTLGCIVRDRDTGQNMMLTNYHVIAEKWNAGENITQPSRVDTGSCPGGICGQLVRSVISENVDGALASISGRGNDCSIHEIGDVKGKGTASENMKVRKRGRTTGLTHGIVESIDATVNVPYDHGNVILRNQITIEADESQSDVIGMSGDSGSVVVDESNRVVGLYFAGTDDGKFGVANPIDAVLDELNVDICVGVVQPKLIIEDFDWKPWWFEHINWKDRVKEVSYEKFIPEYIDWYRRLPVDPVMRDPIGHGPIGGPGGGFGGGLRGFAGAGTNAGAGLEQRVTQLEAMLAGGGMRPQAGPGGVGTQALRCADFASFGGVGPVPNPVSTSGFNFEVYEFNGSPKASNSIVNWGGSPGLNAGYTTQITHSACRSVRVTLVRMHNSPPTVTAYDASGSVVATASMTVGQGVPQELTLSGGGIVRVTVQSPQNEVSIIRYCCDSGGKPIIKIEKIEKLEKQESKEFKEPKEFKEFKEFKDESKELKERPKELKEKDFKDKKEKDVKEFKEKDVKEIKEKDVKELKEKDFKDGKEKDFKEDKEKDIFEGPGFKHREVVDPPMTRQPPIGFPGGAWPGGFGPGGMGPGGFGPRSLEERIARLEALLGGQHFIGQELRPDLSHGALRYEQGGPCQGC